MWVVVWRIILRPNDEQFMLPSLKFRFRHSRESRTDTFRIPHDNLLRPATYVKYNANAIETGVDRIATALFP